MISAWEWEKERINESCQRKGLKEISRNSTFRPQIG
jgi:hypothetical protein